MHPAFKCFKSLYHSKGRIKDVHENCKSNHNCNNHTLKIIQQNYIKIKKYGITIRDIIVASILNVLLAYSCEVLVKNANKKYNNI